MKLYGIYERGRYLGNIFVERLWRSVKYEEVYLKAYRNGSEARRGIDAWSTTITLADRSPIAFAN